MKLLSNIILIFFFFNVAIAENHLQFFIDAALKNNLKLNAERKNQKSIKQNINISRSEFLPSISLSGDQSSSQSNLHYFSFHSADYYPVSNLEWAI